MPAERATDRRPSHYPEPTETPVPLAEASHRHRLSDAVLLTATRWRPLVAVLEAVQSHTASDSVFHTRRLRINAQIARVYDELKAEKPSRKTLLHAFQTMGELVKEEARDISKDELKQAAKEVVLATLKNAPGLISAAHQARLLS
ncbi:hypothetical protein MUN81_04340 [Hymenobacter sp. 5317J-9]|uniref:hypothetical protein n=1 Tax=Hymenobacter sp. 5317J-9 TaxID=2932250 RepID=UPI001FD638FA|nr:hypothetical protein [Hymenobacter sp. 5317J-9]UOQ98723.1 hypothetical protein MUN81_04340 [Hymenobacter sp. 5317J-9]